MKTLKIALLIFVLLHVVAGIIIFLYFHSQKPEEARPVKKEAYWFILQRKSNFEYLYRGVPGDKNQSTTMKRFVVKSGITGERPTPLPQLVGRKYWLITKKEATENPETAPYFLTLNVPGIEDAPYGPVPYNECDGQQCNWILPGAFGLHGVNGDPSRLSPDDPGSSGCIRHSDADITYLFKLLDPGKSEIRYYIEDV